jgi:nitric oxide reductase subunit C
MRFDDPAFWRAGAISTIIVMLCVLAMLTVDSLQAITPGGSHVPPYTVINRHIDYVNDAEHGIDVPVIGPSQPLFGKVVDAQAATAMMDKANLVIQSRACMDCHTFFGNGAYYGPDLTKAWLDPDWEAWQSITGTATKEDAMVAFLKDPQKYATWTPNLLDGLLETLAMTSLFLAQSITWLSKWADKSSATHLCC